MGMAILAPEHSWRERKATTLKDIAQAVGVSESTVSVVVNGARSGTRVSAQTRAAVLEAAQRLGYRPNFYARSLVSGRSNRIGLYSGKSRLDSRNHFFSDLLGGILDGSAQARINTVVHTAEMADADLIDMVNTKAVDGLIVHLDRGDKIVRSLAQMRVPAVNVADRIDDIPSVCVADSVGGKLQAEHLAELGHRHVLYKQATEPPPSSLDRLQAFLNTATELGMEVTISAGDDVDQEILTSEDIRLLTQPKGRVTAVVGWCDQVAERICQSLTNLGLSIPEDVAVVGFDGMHYDVARKFNLTTIRAPWFLVGKTAVDTLLALGRGENVPAVTVLPVEFVRGSTT